MLSTTDFYCFKRDVAHEKEVFLKLVGGEFWLADFGFVNVNSCYLISSQSEGRPLTLHLNCDHSTGLSM